MLGENLWKNPGSSWDSTPANTRQMLLLSYWAGASLVPRPSWSSVCRLQYYNAGEGLVKLSHVVWRTWTCEGVAHSWKNSKLVSALLIANTDHRTTERSTSERLSDVSWIQKAVLQLYRRNVPLLHTSRYIIPRDSVLPGLPPH